MGSLAFALRKIFRVRAWDGPFGDVLVECVLEGEETGVVGGWKGPLGSGRRRKKRNGLQGISVEASSVTPLGGLQELRMNNTG